MEKECFKCKKTLELCQFYKHKQMADGYLNKCKECAKVDAHKHRQDNLEKIRDYDRARNKARPNVSKRVYRDKYPNKYKAHGIVNNSMRSGKLFKEPCAVCGTTERIQAHHDDYLKPLNVTWLCAVHHSEWHLKNGEGANG